MAECENLLERLTRYPDGTLRKWAIDHPASMAQVLNSCATELDKIPEMPMLGDPRLTGAAAKAFEQGYGAGMDEVAHRIFLMELAVDTIELILVPELMLAEVVVTRAIRTSLSALRRMPIFIPGAVGAAGAFVKLAPKAVATAVARGSSKVLAKAMQLAGKIRLPGEFAHHIVAHGDERAAESLKILNSFGIGVDDAVNGVFLPGFKKSPNPQGKAVHSSVHTNAYHRAVLGRLKKATTKQEAIDILHQIAMGLEKGVMP